MTYVDARGQTTRFETMTGWRNFYTTAALVLLISFASICSVLFLAATLTQARLSAVAVDGVNISIWKLDSIRDQWKDRRKQSRMRRDDLARALFNKAELATKRNDATADAERSRRLLTSLIEYVSLSGSSVVPELAKDVRGLESIHEKVAHILAKRDALTSQPDLMSLLKDLSQNYNEYIRVTASGDIATLSYQNLVYYISDLEDAVRDSDNAVIAVVSSITTSMDKATRARIENAIFELDPADNLIGKIWKSLIITQPDVLTLWLVVLMGVLGSSLQIAHSFFKGRQIDTAGSYFLRLGVGAVTALVIFVVAKAGVPIIADASKLGGDAPINPYFISFIAIISGLLSERAIIAVQTQGARFFAAANQDPDRWARYDLTERLQAPDLSEDILASHLGIRTTQLRDILTGVMPANGEQQRVISIYLRVELRDIFTDVPPRRSEPPPQAEPAPA